MKVHKLLPRAIVLLIGCIYLFVALTSVSCVEGQKLASRTGVQLWAENCQRCHNIPSAKSFSADQWETIGMHMQSRALLTENEKNKVIAFLKGTGQ